jgi:hypothetical protein
VETDPRLGNSKPPGPMRNTEQQSDHIYYTLFLGASTKKMCPLKEQIIITYDTVITSFYFSLRKSRQCLCHSLSILCIITPLLGTETLHIMCSALEGMNWNYNVKCFVRNRLHCYHPHPFLAAPLVVRLQHLPHGPFTHYT